MNQAKPYMMRAQLYGQLYQNSIRLKESRYSSCASAYGGCENYYSQCRRHE